jgi:hypothetical protein
MTRASKLGVASVILFICADLLLGTADGIFSVICGCLSCLLGVFAAREGSKWWFTVPALNVLFFSFMVWVGFHAV